MSTPIVQTAPSHTHHSFGEVRSTDVFEDHRDHSPQDLQSATRLSEHQVIMATLAESTNREEAARRLGISPRTLRYKLAQFKAHGLSMAA